VTTFIKHSNNTGRLLNYKAFNTQKLQSNGLNEFRVFNANDSVEKVSN
jgi:hypothetical protein